MNLDELKEKHKEAKFFLIELENSGISKEIVVGIRKPKVIDLEVFIKEAKGNLGLVPYHNLLSRVLIYPNGKEKETLLADMMEEYPLALQSFVEDKIRPFFGRVKRTVLL